MKRRHFILLLGGASSGALGIGTGAFSSVDADRGVEVNVVEDENAYLGLERLPAADSVTVGDKTEVVKITNQFADGLDLSVIIDDPGDGIDEIEVEEPVEIVEEDDGDESEGEELSPGNEAYISVECATPGDTSFTLSFSGDAGGASVDKTRTFEITCESTDTTCETCESGGTELTVTDVEFLNSGKVKIQADGGDEVCAKAYISQGEGGDPQWTPYTPVPVGENLQAKQFCWGNNGGKIRKVEIKGGDTFTRDDN